MAVSTWLTPVFTNVFWVQHACTMLLPVCTIAKSPWQLQADLLCCGQTGAEWQGAGAGAAAPPAPRAAAAHTNPERLRRLFHMQCFCLLPEIGGERRGAAAPTPALQPVCPALCSSQYQTMTLRRSNVTESGGERRGARAAAPSAALQPVALGTRARSVASRCSLLRCCWRRGCAGLRRSCVLRQVCHNTTIVQS